MSGEAKPVADPDQKPLVLVVGAGCAGLQTLRALLRAGIRAIAVEETGTVGGVWQANYSGFALQVPWHLYQFAEFPYPPALRPLTPYASGREVHRYMQAYAAHFGLLPHIRFHSRLERLECDPVTGVWAALVADTSSHSLVELHASFVVLATGAYSEPNIPPYKGQANYTGLQVHSRNFGDATMVQGKRLLIVGGGKSALDCATQVTMAAQVKKVTLLMRRKKWPFPRHMGVLSAELLYSRATSAMLPPYYTAGPVRRAMNVLGQPAKSLFWRVMERGVRKAFKHVVKWENPPGSLMQDLLHDGQIVDDTWMLLENDKRVERWQGDIDHFTSSGVVLTDGRVLECDVVLYCTGYTRTYEFLDPDLRAKLAPAPDGLWLYRNMLPPGLPGLAFVGCEVNTLANITTHALQAEWLLGLLLGRVALPSLQAQEADINAQRAWKAGVMPAQLQNRSAALTLYMQDYHDQLLTDLGLPRARKAAGGSGGKGSSLLGALGLGCLSPTECFRPYTAMDYAGLYACQQLPATDVSAGSGEDSKGDGEGEGARPISSSTAASAVHGTVWMPKHLWKWMRKHKPLPLPAVPQPPAMPQGQFHLPSRIPSGVKPYANLSSPPSQVCSRTASFQSLLGASPCMVGSGVMGAASMVHATSGPHSRQQSRLISDVDMELSPKSGLAPQASPSGASFSKTKSGTFPVISSGVQPRPASSGDHACTLLSFDNAAPQSGSQGPMPCLAISPAQSGPIQRTGALLNGGTAARRGSILTCHGLPAMVQPLRSYGSTSMLSTFDGGFPSGQGASGGPSGGQRPMLASGAARRASVLCTTPAAGSGRGSLSGQGQIPASLTSSTGAGLDLMASGLPPLSGNSGRVQELREEGELRQALKDSIVAGPKQQGFVAAATTHDLEGNAKCKVRHFSGSLAVIMDDLLAPGTFAMAASKQAGGGAGGIPSGAGAAVRRRRKHLHEQLRLASPDQGPGLPPALASITSTAGSTLASVSMKSFQVDSMTHGMSNTAGADRPSCDMGQRSFKGSEAETDMSPACSLSEARPSSHGLHVWHGHGTHGGAPSTCSRHSFSDSGSSAAAGPMRLPAMLHIPSGPRSHASSSAAAEWTMPPTSGSAAAAANAASAAQRARANLDKLTDDIARRLMRSLSEKSSKEQATAPPPGSAAATAAGAAGASTTTTSSMPETIATLARIEEAEMTN